MPDKSDGTVPAADLNDLVVETIRL